MRTQITPWQTARPITPGTPVAAGTGVFIDCTVQGVVRLKMADGATTIDVQCNVGPNVLPGFAVVDVDAANTTAAATVSVLS